MSASASSSVRLGPWNRLLWALVFPRRHQRIVPTVSGTLLISVALGIGTAAYNSANNILFITLAVLLACLVLSGVLSWLNLRGVEWRLDVAPPLRVGHVAGVSLGLRNHKSFLPTYGLWFDVEAKPEQDGPPAVVESTITGKGIDVRAALAKAEAVDARGQLVLRERLDPRGEVRLDWTFQPVRRGRLLVDLVGVGSLFPFGFLRKTFSTEQREARLVWPAAVEYRRHAAASERLPAGSEWAPQAGSGGDLWALRRYAPGDSHRLIHWKASARSQTLLVRQFAAESTTGFALALDTSATVWTRPEQFELLVSFCATLAEDLFRLGQLESARIDDEAPRPMRRVRDLEQFLDRLAVVQPRTESPAGGGSTARLRNVLTFTPDGARGVIAIVNGEKAASA
ncbi:MAG TPA: DUF58 domain-containing protein [Opitutaceae bacterium]|nr:DUF58 domain-containing protein [Opitutaceae bacterium]HND60198.1 DUF58 domain-containing protein [Opitutaceae bacterium]